jgi:predicted lysophospholipase L1 biosynthesis ABC-type transport system permease subunit
MRAVAGAEARPLLRVTATRARLVTRLSWILAAAGVLTVVLALGTLTASSLAQLHARRGEVALFFALGYSRAWVSRLLALELLGAGAVAWLLGALGGELLAARFARQLLGAGDSAASLVAWAAGAAAALLGAALALAVTVHLTTRRLGALQPAALLAGR